MKKLKVGDIIYQGFISDLNNMKYLINKCEIIGINKYSKPNINYIIVRNFRTKIDLKIKENFEKQIYHSKHYKTHIFYRYSIKDIIKTIKQILKENIKEEIKFIKQKRHYLKNIETIVEETILKEI